MYIIIFIEIFLTMFQLVMCGVSFSFLFIVIPARLLSIVRVYNVRCNIKIIYWMEGISILMRYIIPVLFKSRLNWLELVMSAIISSISCLIIYYDEDAYVYIEKEEED